jgi:hypothetical protein
MDDKAITQKAADAWARILNMDGGQPQAIAAGMWASIYADKLIALAKDRLSALPAHE